MGDTVQNHVAHTAYPRRERHPTPRARRARWLARGEIVRAPPRMIRHVREKRRDEQHAGDPDQQGRQRNREPELCPHRVTDEPVVVQAANELQVRSHTAEAERDAGESGGPPEFQREHQRLMGQECGGHVVPVSMGSRDVVTCHRSVADVLDGSPTTGSQPGVGHATASQRSSARPSAAAACVSIQRESSFRKRAGVPQAKRGSHERSSPLSRTVTLCPN